MLTPKKLSFWFYGDFKYQHLCISWTDRQSVGQIVDKNKVDRMTDKMTDRELKGQANRQIFRQNDKDYQIKWQTDTHTNTNTGSYIK